MSNTDPENEVGQVAPHRRVEDVCGPEARCDLVSPGKSADKNAQPCNR